MGYCANVEFLITYSLDLPNTLLAIFPKFEINALLQIPSLHIRTKCEFYLHGKTPCY